MERKRFFCELRYNNLQNQCFLKAESPGLTQNASASSLWSKVSGSRVKSICEEGRQVPEAAASSQAPQGANVHVPPPVCVCLNTKDVFS